MEFIAEVVQNSPLTVHFSLCNPVTASGPIYAPRLLAPLGYFVKIEVSDGNKIVFLIREPKADFKVRADQDEAYVELNPGYTHGITFVLDDFKPDAGYYQLRLSYTNRDYTGSPDLPVGELSYRTEVPMYID